MWNLAVLVVVDMGKVCVRNLIGEPPGDTIDSDVLLPPSAPKSEETLQQEKEARLSVHRHSTLSPSDTAHNVEFTGRPGMFTDGIIQNTRRLGMLGKTGAVGSSTTNQKGKNKNANFQTPETEMT